MNLRNHSNEYANMIDREIFDKIPKSVFAAIAVSFLLNYQTVDEDNITQEIINEWKALHDNKIVYQKPIAIKSSKKSILEIVNEISDEFGAQDEKYDDVEALQSLEESEE